MENLNSSVAQQIAQAAIAFQQQRTGHEPLSVAVVLSGDTLLITLHGALTTSFGKNTLERFTVWTDEVPEGVAAQFSASF